MLPTHHRVLLPIVFHASLMGSAAYLISLCYAYVSIPRHLMHEIAWSEKGACIFRSAYGV